MPAMTDETTATPPLPGLLARAIGIVTSPTETFRRVVETPRAVGILFFVAAILAVAVGAPQFTETGKQAVLDAQVQQIERFTHQPVTDAQLERMQTTSRYTPYISIASIFIVLPITALILAGLYWVVFNALLGGTASYKQVLAVNTHAMVISALGAAIGAPVQYIKGTASQSGPFNLGALVPMLDERGFVATLLGSISVFSIWGVIVVAIGLGVLYKRKSSSIAIGLFAVYGLLLGGWTYFISR
jgi:hypothetical protein